MPPRSAAAPREFGTGEADATMLGLTVTIRFVDTGVAPAKVIAGGLNEHVTPAGRVPHEKLIVPEYAGFGVAVTTNVADCPGLSVALVGLADSTYAWRASFTFCDNAALV
jgi:hypothetical protein